MADSTTPNTRIIDFAALVRAVAGPPKRTVAYEFSTGKRFYNRDEQGAYADPPPEE